MTESVNIEKIHDSQISQTDTFINFKIIIIGDSGVGKSTLLKRAVYNRYDESYQATIGFEFLLMHFKVNDLKIKLQIWDTCGEEMYRSLVQGFYRNTSLAIIVYDVSDEKSFKSAEMWLQDLRQHTEADLPVFLVGNKNDLERKVSQEEAKDFYEKYNLQFCIESSAKNNYNIKEIFFEASKCLYNNYKKVQSINNNIPMVNRLKLDNNNKDSDNQKKKKCC